ncbi:MAG: hypothetical protein Q8R28_10585 [Dehalococcoidia bacterium]|nr:hypothetical protein [Dehalococcoidia bacterium]
MKKNTYIIALSAALLAASALLHFVHWLIFQDMHHLLLYGLEDLAFIPLEVFVVVVVIERALESRDSRAKIDKLNVVIGAFFSEVGAGLLGGLLPYFQLKDEIKRRLAVTEGWDPKDFRAARAFAGGISGPVTCLPADLEELKVSLVGKRHFLLRLLENPNILEHDRFTDLIWAVFHLMEELDARPSLQHLPESDLRHIAGDLSRVYGQLACEWVSYVEHLKSSYPFLFSLVCRTHPLQERPSPMVSS